MKVPSRFWSRWRVRLGYPLALVFLVLAAPTRTSLLAGGAIAALGLLIRGAAAGHLKKGQALATFGPYAYTRNPLYLGSSFLAAGFIVAAWSPVAAALVAVYFVFFYWAVMKREEADLLAGYGKQFEEYARRVPLFFPALRPAKSGSVASQGFSWVQYRRNREYQALLGACVGIVLLWLRMMLRARGY
ncbi:MAG: methyltransferase family protein [Candidatus Acidiferrales bacterium]